MCAGDPVGISVGSQIHHFHPRGVLRLGVPSVVGIEVSHTRRRGYQVVVGVVGHPEQVHPIILLLDNVWSEVCFDNQVDSFGLSIGL